MKVAKLTITDGTIVKTSMHHPGVAQPWDVSLCGQDLMGDNIGTEKWQEAVAVNGKIDCPDCLAIIRTCRALRRSDFISD